MIFWKDFILDDVVGPIMIDPSDLDVALATEEKFNETSFESCRRTRLGSTIVMEDETGIIQETRQEQRPARMVGHSSLDFSAEPHMDVSSSNRASTGQRPRGKA